MKKIFLVTTILYISVLLLSTSAIAKKEKSVDYITQVECAQFDPEVYRWQISAERWVEKEEMIKEYDWTMSCVNYIKYPVAK